VTAIEVIADLDGLLTTNIAGNGGAIKAVIDHADMMGTRTGGHVLRPSLASTSGMEESDTDSPNP
jgi:hypothetical protein